MNPNKLTRAMKFAAYLAFTLLSAGVASAGTYTIPAGSGTLTYSETTTTYPCVIRQGDNSSYSFSTYSSFSYKSSSGVTTPLSGKLIAYWGSGAGSCIRAILPITFITPGFGIVFTPTSYTGGTATFYPAGVLYPKYKILSIIYDAPGNKSCDGYSISTTDGTTTTIGNTFQQGNSTTDSESVGLFGIGGTLSFTYGTSTTTGNSSAFTDTISQGSGVSNCSVANTINHNQDLFILWLNPSVTLIQTGGSSLTYGVGSQTQTTGDPNPGQPEATDAVEVTAEAMMPNAQGVTTVPDKLSPGSLTSARTLYRRRNVLRRTNVDAFPAISLQFLTKTRS
jgi:hypothetical protein